MARPPAHRDADASPVVLEPLLVDLLQFPPSENITRILEALVYIRLQFEQPSAALDDPGIFWGIDRGCVARRAVVRHIYRGIYIGSFVVLCVCVYGLYV